MSNRMSCHFHDVIRHEPDKIRGKKKGPFFSSYSITDSLFLINLVESEFIQTNCSHTNFIKVYISNYFVTVFFLFIEVYRFLLFLKRFKYLSVLIYSYLLLTYKLIKPVTSIIIRKRIFRFVCKKRLQL